tara:strand:+ start:2615 stop:2989 length:375 start_codon:yes stop_codon:yes gene_type:complete
MANPRELTEVEKFYIENNLDKTDSEIASKMKGVGVKTVSKHRESVPKTEVEDKTQSITETRQERMERLADGPEAGELMARRDGTAIMTQQASEVTDARKIVKGTQASESEITKNNRGKIHRPKS